MLSLLSQRFWIQLASVAAAAMTLLACSGDEPSVNGAQTPSARVRAAQAQSNVFSAATFLPLPAAGPVDAATQAARDRILGPNATDPSVVNLWWVGVSSFIVALQGHLFLLDAWEIVGLHANYLPIGREELAAIKPEAIFVGHGHFDHAADVGYVAGQSNAVLVAGSTVCNTARQRAASAGLKSDFPCIHLGNDGSPVGLLQSVKVWADVAPVTVIRHTHSAAEPKDLAAGGAPLVYIPDVLTYPAYLNTSPQEAAAFLRSLTDDGGLGQPDGGTWAFHFRADHFSLFWHDSTGVMQAGNADSQAIVNAIKQLPDCVDVQLNAIVGFGMVTSAFRDALAYVEAVQPTLSLPNHHDAWAPGIGGGARSYEQAWRSALSSLKRPPMLDYLRDPEDYMKKRSFRLDDPRWNSSCGRSLGRAQ